MTHSIIGLWQLCSFELKTETGKKEYPLGNDPQGYIIYTDKGFMSAHLGFKHRAHVASPSNLDVSANEALALVTTYNSYCGRYEVRADKVFHHVELCMFSNWENITLERTFKVTGKILQLSHHLETAEGVKDFIALWQNVGFI